MPGGGSGSASFDLSPVPAGQAIQALPIVVALYEPGDDGGFTILPNVRCLRIDYREGPEPPLARFQYFMDDLLESAMGWPSQFEKLWPIDAQGDYVVLTDDRLVVMTQIPSSSPDQDPQIIFLFDGFAQVPQVDLGVDQQAVTFVAQGVAVRLWDSPITGRTQRDASNADKTDGSSDVPIQLPCRFNPSDTSVGSQGGYIGNCVATSDYSEVGNSTYPVFLDPLVLERGDNFTSYWYVSDALSYLIVTEPSPNDDNGDPYVTYPTLSSLKDLLACQAPPDNGLLNSGDATATDIQIRDYDASNKSVPDVFAELLRYCGFVMYFFLDTNGGDEESDPSPTTSLKIVRKDALATTTPKLLYLAADNSPTLNLASNNTTALHLARDCNELVNQWSVETALKQVEVSVLLAPAFQPLSADALPANIVDYFSSNLTDATSDVRRLYRWWIADECADGHYNVETSSWVPNTAIDLTPIFPVDKDGNYTYVDRYRPGSQTLISKDAEGKPLKAVLQILPGFSSGDPKLENTDDTENWTTITRGWRLLDDRLGIEITVENPNEWHTGAIKHTDGSATLTTIRAIDWLANATDQTDFILRLTTVIDADARIPDSDILAKMRKASPTQFARERVADGRDHFQYCAVAPHSIYYTSDGGDGTNLYVIRDDTAAAKTHAEQLRSAHEFPTLAGSATLPFITDYYQIGDRVKIIQGRNANLQINVGVDQGEAPTYPWVTAFAWDFQGDKQQTVIQFSDRRAEPQGV
jgi:hypothetical protein